MLCTCKFLCEPLPRDNIVIHHDGRECISEGADGSLSEGERVLGLQEGEPREGGERRVSYHVVGHAQRAGGGYPDEGDL